MMPQGEINFILSKEESVDCKASCAEGQGEKEGIRDGTRVVPVPSNFLNGLCRGEVATQHRKYPPLPLRGQAQPYREEE